MNIMTDNILDMCAYAYIEYYRNQFKKYAWAADYAETLIQTNPKAGLIFVLNVLNVCQNEQEIAYVGSGALEDLLHRYLFETKEDIKNIIQTNESLSTAMRYVWVGIGSPVSDFLAEININLSIKMSEKRPQKTNLIKSISGDE